MVRLEAIKFNHDPTSASFDALNLRRNGTDWVHVPEWRRGISVNPEDSPAAYAVARVSGHVVTIMASLSCADPSVHSVEVRARDNVVDPGGPGGCLGLCLALFRWLIRALFGNVLGEVRQRTVTFVNGQSGFLPFVLVHTRLDAAPVGARTTEWRWQYRSSQDGPWRDFAITRHRIYTVIDLPTDPWQQTPYDPSNLQLPWADALDYACDWARASATTHAAAAGVTRGVYDLGPSVVTYDCPGGGSSHYSWGAFDCAAFLDRLQGGVGNGYYVNCSDCATFVSTMANLLGCDLWQSRMYPNGWGGFGLNPLLGIGSNVWQPACGWSGFSYHEVAWTGACDVNDHVFDACLEVDGDIDPTTAPHAPLLPVDLRFGNPGDMDYRDRLATPAGSPDCQAQPGSRQRRPIS